MIINVQLLETFAQNYPSILIDEMDVYVTSEVIKWATTGMSDLNFENSKLAEYIREKCEKKFKGSWTVIIGNGYTFSTSKALNNNLYFKFDDKYFLVYKH